MAPSKLLVVVPVLSAGLFVPGFQSQLPSPDGPRQIGMTQEGFARSTITIAAGSSLTFVNNSRYLHVLAFGTERGTPAGAPVFHGAYGTQVSQSGDRYTTAAWTTPGVYHVICTLHPEMTLTVVVRGH